MSFESSTNAALLFLVYRITIDILWRGLCPAVFRPNFFSHYFYFSMISLISASGPKQIFHILTLVAFAGHQYRLYLLRMLFC